eukprot:4198247-Karenia_brevis.AAC.1
MAPGAVRAVQGWGMVRPQQRSRSYPVQWVALGRTGTSFEDLGNPQSNQHGSGAGQGVDPQ